MLSGTLTWLKQTVTIYPYSSINSYGEYSFGVGVSTPCRIESVDEQVINEDGTVIFATAKLTVDGSKSVSVNSAATKSPIRCISFDSSAGAFTPDRTILIMEGAGASTLKLAAGGSVNSLILKGATELASNVTVSNVCAHVNPISKGAFTLTLSKPENEYTGLRRPIVVPVKKLDIGPVGPADKWLQDLGEMV